ncbi:hypothetical protein QU862_32390, partial [Escherichia coli]|nr:hypothetical protein [Escherichia coli]
QSLNFPRAFVVVGYKVKDVTDVHGADEPIDFHEPDWHGGQCQSGSWKGNKEKEHFTVYGTSGCGHTVSYAVCPSGSILVSGGYQLTAWSQDNRNPFNSPDSTYPDWANNRWIVGGTGTITSCFRSVALCAR